MSMIHSNAQPVLRSRLKIALLSVGSALTIALTLTACHSSTMNKPDIKQNPHPKLRYEITMTIKDAPGPFESVKAFVGYETNSDCVPVRPVSGATRFVSFRREIDFHLIAPNTYQGAVYLDLLQDEDYYGMGMCHWKTPAIGMAMKVGEVSFDPDLFGDEIISLQPKMQYFAKSFYGNNSILNMPVSGSQRNEFTSKNDADFFSTTITIKKDFQ